MKTSEDPHSFDVVGIDLDEPFQKYSFIKRRFQEVEYSKLLVEQIKHFDPEVVILANIPPDAHRVVYKAFRNSDIKFIFWVQDLYGIAIKRMLSSKIPGAGALIGRYYIWQERRLLKLSDEVVLISEDFCPILKQWGIAENRINVIPNWAPIDEIPVRPKVNQWAEANELHNSFCILYSGTLGMKHNPDLLLQLALHFADEPRIKIVVLSEGLGAQWLQRQKSVHKLENLMLFKFQPFSQYADVLGSADILVAILESDAGMFSVPSKVLSYLCANRPLLLAVPKNNLAARIVVQNKAGLVVEPGEVQSFIEAADTLVKNQALCKEYAHNALSYARKNFDIIAIADRFESIIL